MKHIKKILALALIAVSLFAVALPAMAGSGTSTLSSGNETDLARHNNIGGKTNFQATILIQNCPAGSYGVKFMYANSAGTRKNGQYAESYGMRYLSANFQSTITDTTQNGEKAYDYWLRLNPNGQAMTVTWTLSCS